VEGASALKHRRRHANNRVGRLVDLMHQVDRGDAHHNYAVLLEPGVAALIALRPITHVIAYPVDLNREAGFGAIEVEHVRPNRMLTSKDRPARETCPQSAPQP
jgi:hypothetical protein